MNKKILYYILALTLVASCKRDDDHVFDKSPDERINETLKTYQTKLTSSQYGWNGNLHTADGTLYRFYFSFNDSNRVQMLGDFDSTSGSELMESSYRLKALQQPSLIFDTYSYLHVLSDPDGSVNGGQDGVGLKADFEFAIDSSGFLAADTIALVGRFNGSVLTMTKATQADRTIWTTKQVGNGVTNFKNYWKFLSYWKRLNYRSTDYELQFDTTVKKVTVSWGNGQTATREYYFWANGVYFAQPIVNGSVSIPGFSITGFTDGTAASQVMNVTVNGTAATIKGVGPNVAPLNPDVKNAVTRWRNQAASGNYWISFNGFHANGVEDAFKINTLKNDSAIFYYLLYSPNTAGSDAFFTIYLDTLNLPLHLDAISGSWAKQAVNRTTGLTKITQDSVASKLPWPASGPAFDTRNQLFSGTGNYYFVQSSAIAYDMVSVDDPSVWITWWWIW